MLFNYKAIDTQGLPKAGSIDAINVDVAISALQRRGLIISFIKEGESLMPWWKRNLTFFDRISNKDVVILSRQMATLFTAQISALRVFRLLATESVKPELRVILLEVSDDLQGGLSISKALGRHPKVFSDFYVNMVRSGEESGKLDEVLLYLADYLDRSYEVTSKVRNALVYPAFILFTFIVVMIIMLVAVIPKITVIIVESGQEIPIYTKIVIWVSDLFINYGFFLFTAVVGGGYFFLHFIKGSGRLWWDTLKVRIPYLGSLYKKMYLGRLADNMSTMLQSGIPISKSIEVTASVIDNVMYENVLLSAEESIRAGNSISDSFAKYKQIPGMVVQMVRVGEESGELGTILKTLAKFYDREVSTAVDTLIDLIEPALIISLAVAVAILLAAVIVPIYSISNSIS